MTCKPGICPRGLLPGFALHPRPPDPRPRNRHTPAPTDAPHARDGARPGYRPGSVPCAFVGLVICDGEVGRIAAMETATRPPAWREKAPIGTAWVQLTTARPDASQQEQETVVRVPRCQTTGWSRENLCCMTPRNYSEIRAHPQAHT
jgi:hypothetical protein